MLLALPVEDPETETDEVLRTLKYVSDRVYESNQGARGVMEELSVHALTIGEVRNTLQRRVDSWQK